MTFTAALAPLVFWFTFLFASGQSELVLLVWAAVSGAFIVIFESRPE